MQRFVSRRWRFGMLVAFALLAASTVMTFLPAIRQNIANVRTAAAIVGEQTQPAAERQASPYLRGMDALVHGDPATAAAAFQKISATGGTLARRGLALSLEQSGQWQNALAALQSSQLNELHLMGDIILRHWATADTNARRAFLDQVRAYAPTELALYAQRLQSQLAYDDSTTWAKAALALAPSAEAYMVIGSNQFYAGDLAAAEATLAKAYQLAPTGMIAYWYARVLAEHGAPENAIPILQNLVAQTSAGDKVIAWYLRELGTAYALAHRCQDGRNTLEQARRVDASPDNAQRIDEAGRRLDLLCGKG